MAAAQELLERQAAVEELPGELFELLGFMHLNPTPGFARPANVGRLGGEENRLSRADGSRRVGDPVSTLPEIAGQC